MPFFETTGVVDSFEFGVVRFEFWVFPCSQFSRAVFRQFMQNTEC
jgi:hypothetical protein